MAVCVHSARAILRKLKIVHILEILCSLTRCMIIATRKRGIQNHETKKSKTKNVILRNGADRAEIYCKRYSIYHRAADRGHGRACIVVDF